MGKIATFLLLIFSLITIPVFACGGCRRNSGTTLKMYMGVGVNVQQKFEATARAYDASFCGFSGEAIDYTPLTVRSCECGWLETATYVKIAQVDIASNYPNVIVDVSYKDTFSPHLTPKVRVFSEYGRMCNWIYLNWNRKCGGNEMPFSGRVYVALPREIGKNLRPGRYTATITFTISPICSCSQ